MAFNGARVVDDERVEDVRRLLGGLAGSQKMDFGTNKSNRAGSKPPVVSDFPVKQAAVPFNNLVENDFSLAPPAKQSPQVPRIPLQNTSNFFPRIPAEEAQKSQIRAAPAGQGGTTVTTANAQELLYQLRQTESQPMHGFQSGTMTPNAAPQSIQPQRQVRRNRDALGRNGKKKTDVEKENDRLLDELEALGEPALEIPGETPVDENQRLRREATAAMLKHSFFIKPRQTPPSSRATSSLASGDSSQRM